MVSLWWVCGYISLKISLSIHVWLKATSPSLPPTQPPITVDRPQSFNLSKRWMAFRFFFSLLKEFSQRWKVPLSKSNLSLPGLQVRRPALIGKQTNILNETEAKAGHLLSHARLKKYVSQHNECRWTIKHTYEGGGKTQPHTLTETHKDNTEWPRVPVCLHLSIDWHLTFVSCQTPLAAGSIWTYHGTHAEPVWKSFKVFIFLSFFFLSW